MLKVPKGESSEQKGPWWRPLKVEHGISAWMRGPCQHYFMLTEHIIEVDGTVKPSVVCPEIIKDMPENNAVLCPKCGFHDCVILEGWDNEKYVPKEYTTLGHKLPKQR